MLGGHYFRRLRGRRAAAEETAPPKREDLLKLLTESVVNRFARISHVGHLAVPLLLPMSEEAEEPPPHPIHPACAEHAESDYCQESWQLHLAELGHQPETHWHRCDYERLCAYVPVVLHGRCPAVIKLACPASMTEQEFESDVELLNVLVEGFAASEADKLEPFLFAGPPAAQPASAAEGAAIPTESSPSHPHVLRALQYIEEHLADPKLTVHRVARELGIHPNYLSHLFADQVGQRMARFISMRRVDRAKTLLATTPWQIKRIAHETGHANSNWFCHVFGILTGLTPGQYRKKTCGSHEGGPG
jgi:AraC-like DNA-binding protein